MTTAGATATIVSSVPATTTVPVTAAALTTAPGSSPGRLRFCLLLLSNEATKVTAPPSASSAIVRLTISGVLSQTQIDSIRSILAQVLGIPVSRLIVRRSPVAARQQAQQENLEIEISGTNSGGVANQLTASLTSNPALLTQQDPSIGTVRAVSVAPVSSGGLSDGAIAGIVIGAVIGAAVLILMVVMLVRHLMRKDSIFNIKQRPNPAHQSDVPL